MRRLHSAWITDVLNRRTREKRTGRPGECYNRSHAVPVCQQVSIWLDHDGFPWLDPLPVTDRSWPPSTFAVGATGIFPFFFAPGLGLCSSSCAHFLMKRLPKPVDGIGAVPRRSFSSPHYATHHFPSKAGLFSCLTKRPLFLLSQLIIRWLALACVLLAFIWFEGPLIADSLSLGFVYTPDPLHLLIYNVHRIHYLNLRKRSKTYGNRGKTKLGMPSSMRGPATRV
jgi:hypothetical protein